MSKMRSEHMKPTHQNKHVDFSNNGYTKEKLTAIVESANDALIIFDQEGKIEFFNQAAQGMFDYAVGDVLGTHISGLISVEPLSSSGAMNTQQQSRRLTLKSGETLGLRGDGQKFPIYLSISEFQSANQQQFVAFLRDISHHHHALQKEQALLEQLAHMARISLMGELTAGIAHEINQPLTAISSYAQAAKNLLYVGSETTISKVIEVQEKITEQAHRADEIIKRLRNFAQKHTIARQNVNLHELIHQSVSLASVDARSQRHQIGVHLQHDVQPLINADPIQIQQVLLNLIRNAFDAMDIVDSNKELIHSIAIHSKQVALNLIEVSVADFGAGLNDEIAEELFTPFFTTKEHGMGMGLSICQTIIHAHGGHIFCSPNEPQGAIFAFRLPMMSAAQSSLGESEPETSVD